MPTQRHTSTSRHRGVVVLTGCQASISCQSIPRVSNSLYTCTRLHGMQTSGGMANLNWAGRQIGNCGANQTHRATARHAVCITLPRALHTGRYSTRRGVLGGWAPRALFMGQKNGHEPTHPTPCLLFHSVLISSAFAYLVEAKLLPAPCLPIKENRRNMNSMVKKQHMGGKQTADTFPAALPASRPPGRCTHSKRRQPCTGHSSHGIILPL